MKLFEKMSAKRFIDQINISDDNEAFIILKLKVNHLFDNY